MAMTSDARVGAIYAAIQNSAANFKLMSTSEQQALRSGLATIFATDLTYITSNAQVAPATLTAEGQSVVVATSTGPAAGTVTGATLTGLGAVI